jgi:exosortase N
MSIMAVRLKPGTKLNAEVFLLAGYVLVAVMGLGSYLPWSSVWFLMGLASFPLLVRRTAQGRIHRGYLLAAVVFLLLCYPVPVKTFAFFGISFSVFFLLEALGCRVGITAWVNLALVSPIFSAAANIFSFPIRLKLTELSGEVLGWIHPSASVRGNMIQFNGGEFSVDPACMGLNMLVASLLLGVLLLGIYGRKAKMELKAHHVALFLGGIFLLNLFSNLVRILLLVLFSLMPGTLMHDVTGLACLLLYVALPAVALARWMYRRWGQSYHSLENAGTKKPRLHVHVVMMAGAVLACVQIARTDTYRRFGKDIPAQVNGYAVSEYEPGILKLENGSALIYIKYLRGFYDSEHNPMLCWSGSGYEFREVREEKIAGLTLYSGKLVKGNDVLYSAWWYSNGRHSTNQQTEWRWNMLLGHPPYAIINVSAASREELEREVGEIVNGEWSMVNGVNRESSIVNEGTAKAQRRGDAQRE